MGGGRSTLVGPKEPGLEVEELEHMWGAAALGMHVAVQGAHV